MSSKSYTLVGAVGAMIAFGLMSVPDGAPNWVEYLLGIVNAGIVYFLGHTNPGRVGNAMQTNKG